MLAIKLQRIGKKKQASFRVVIAERRSKLNGRSIEDLGWMNPRTNTFQVNKERVKHWVSVGAKPTDTVHNLLVKASVIEGKKIPKHKKYVKPIEVAVAPAAKVEEAPADSTNSPQVAEATPSVEEKAPEAPNA